MKRKPLEQIFGSLKTSHLKQVVSPPELKLRTLVSMSLKRKKLSGCEQETVLLKGNGGLYTAHKMTGDWRSQDNHKIIR